MNFMATVRQRRSDDGITLPSVMIAASIILIVIVGGAIGIINAVNVQAYSEHFDQATQTTRAKLEVARQAPYSMLFLDPVDEGYRTAEPLTGEQTVTGRSQIVGNFGFKPLERVSHGGKIYTVQTDITWVESINNPDNHLAKRITVETEWKLPDGTSETVKMSAIVSPTPDEQIPRWLDPRYVPPANGAPTQPYMGEDHNNIASSTIYGGGNNVTSLFSLVVDDEGASQINGVTVKSWCPGADEPDIWEAKNTNYADELWWDTMGSARHVIVFVDIYNWNRGGNGQGCDLRTARTEISVHNQQGESLPVIVSAVDFAPRT